MRRPQGPAPSYQGREADPRPKAIGHNGALVEGRAAVAFDNSQILHGPLGQSQIFVTDFFRFGQFMFEAFDLNSFGKNNIRRLILWFLFTHGTLALLIASLFRFGGIR